MDLKSTSDCVKMVTPEDVISRGLKVTRSVGKEKKHQEAIKKGFGSMEEYEGWLYFNRLENPMFEGYSVDVFNYIDGKTLD